ncbi:MAG: hypothetical protein HOP15_08820 [Planctomycetes bacterium]|nr:hypothetical protein [Planctomycetota bacterium]
MNAKLLRSCACLWLFGLLGMWFARAILVVEPHAPVFRIAAAFWIFGGIGYTGLGLSGLVACARREESVRTVAPVDLAGLIRRP